MKGYCPHPPEIFPINDMPNKDPICIVNAMENQFKWYKKDGLRKQPWIPME
jgi:hypothetical protein